MSVLPVGFGSSGGVDTGDIGHSLRCRSAASTYLSKTFGSAADRRKYTVSFWFRRSRANNTIENVFTTSNDTIRFNDDAPGDQLRFVLAGATLRPARQFRDPTAWNHCVVAVDTTQATSTDRVKIYIRGEQETAFAAVAYPSLNADGDFGNNVAHAIGALVGPSQHYDGYLARFCFVGGSQLTPSSFGTLNTDINEWVSKSQSAVKAVVDAGGTNSFMLDFDDATGGLTSLGYDKSSKGNNWTLNNFSLTAGTTYDHMLDVPGNSYATLNPLNAAPTATPTEGNLLAAHTSGATASRVSSTVAVNSGKWYWEATVVAKNNPTYPNVGITPAESVFSNTGSVDLSVTSGAKCIRGDGTNQAGSAYGGALTAGMVLGFALDMDAGTIVVYENNTSQGTLASGLSGYYVAATGSYNNSNVNFNFGQAPLHASATYDSAAGGYFRYTPPTGFKALCQANLPDVAILNPKLHFDIGLVTGNASVDQVISTLFAPDALISKARNAAIDWGWFAKMIGGDKYLSSNTTAAETTSAANTVTFNSNGVSLKAGGSIINDATRTYVDLLLKAGGAAVSNTAGSITSQVSANVDAGFSIVTYTGTGANATVGHGLTKVPKLVIVKQRTAGTVENWAVSHTSIANTEYLLLNTTAAKTAGATYWNSTTPTTSVFSVGSAADTNESVKDFVAYCFADIEGYSRAFSYTGNGSADGPYVHLGFKPKWVMIKSSTLGSEGWIIIDAARDTYNTMTQKLGANYAVAENDTATIGTNTQNLIDSTSNGFKLRTATAGTNGAQTYIGIAFADVAGRYSLAR